MINLLKKHLLFSLRLFAAVSCVLLLSLSSARADDDGDKDLCNIGVIAQKYGLVINNSSGGSSLATGSEEAAAQAEKKCWYCKVVIILSNAYLQAAGSALGTAQLLGQLIVKLGFAIWFALYVLKTVGATSGTTPGKMLSEILVMGCKCAFAYAAIDYGLNFITFYIINPIMLTGTDMGQAILDSMVSS